MIGFRAQMWSKSSMSQHVTPSNTSAADDWGEIYKHFSLDSPDWLQAFSAPSRVYTAHKANRWTAAYLIKEEQ